MRREFSLETISYEHYNALCPHIRAPPDSSPLSPNPERQVQIRMTCDRLKRYFRLTEEVSYSCFDELLDYLDDGVQRILCIQVPHLTPLCNATMMTLQSTRNHTDNLRAWSHSIDRLVINYVKNVKKARRKPGYYTDRLQFNKVNEQWVLCRFHVHRSNYPLYKLTMTDGGADLQHVPAISAVYDIRSTYTPNNFPVLSTANQNFASCAAHPLVSTQLVHHEC